MASWKFPQFPWDFPIEKCPLKAGISIEMFDG
jgi:hypothetical protein